MNEAAFVNIINVTDGCAKLAAGDDVWSNAIVIIIIISECSVVGSIEYSMKTMVERQWARSVYAEIGKMRFLDTIVELRGARSAPADGGTASVERM